MAGLLHENIWKDELRLKFPNHFNGAKVLDIGSADINGTNRGWFTSCQYTGLDIRPYKNVDVVNIAHEYRAKPESFDTVLSTSSLEHDMHWEKTLKKMVELLKPEGLMFFSASHATGEHGTKKSDPLDSLTSQLDNEWANWYYELTKEDIRKVLDLEAIFEKYELFYAHEDKYIRFWGIKRRKDASK